MESNCGSESFRPVTVERGKNVARPPSLRLSIWIAALPQFSSSTTIFCIAAPSAVSIAVVYRSSTRMSFDTGPCTPESAPLAASCMTRRTALEKPSKSRSISRSILAFAASVLSCTDALSNSFWSDWHFSSLALRRRSYPAMRFLADCTPSFACSKAFAHCVFCCSVWTLRVSFASKSSCKVFFLASTSSIDAVKDAICVFFSCASARRRFSCVVSCKSAC